MGCLAELWNWIVKCSCWCCPYCWCCPNGSESERLITREQQATKIGRLNRENKELKEEIRDLRSRLAQEMNNKLAANESSLENISIPCRPMKIAEEYQHFTSNAWLDAKEALDKKVGQEVGRRLLCDILMASAPEARVSYEELLRSISSQLSNPLQGRAQQARDLPRDFIPHIGDYLRRNVDNVDLTPLEEKIREQIYSQNSDASVKSLFEVGDAYFKSAASLAWKMCLQRPPMEFSTPDVDKPFQGHEVHPLAWNSEHPQKYSMIRAYQYPSLMHGEKYMVRGKVYIGHD